MENIGHEDNVEILRFVVHQSFELTLVANVLWKRMLEVFLLDLRKYFVD